MTIQYLKKSPKTSSTDDTKTREIVENILKDIEEKKEEGCKELGKKFDKYDGEIIVSNEKIEERIRLYERLKRPVLFCTTGLKSNELDGIRNLSKEMPIFMAPNTSLVIALMHDLIEKVLNFNNSLEVKISEKHHTSKLDKPSGTALSFAKLTNVKESSIESLFVVSISYSYFSVEFKDALAPTI